MHALVHNDTTHTHTYTHTHTMSAGGLEKGEEGDECRGCGACRLGRHLLLVCVVPVPWPAISFEGMTAPPAN